MNKFSGVRGFNYQMGYGSCSYENWRYFDAERIRQELLWGVTAFPKINTLRIWLSWDAWAMNHDDFRNHFEEMLTIMDEFNLKAIVCLFNRWHNAFCDNGGLYLERLFPSSCQYDRWFFRSYVEDIVQPHANDPRILIWDLCNEPYSHDLAFADVPALIKVETDFLQDLAETVRLCGVEQEIGVSIHGATNKEMLCEVEPFSDVLMIHPYLQWTPEINAYRKKCEAVIRHLDWQVEFAEKKNKEILVTECCWGSIDEDVFRDNIIRTLDEYKKRNLGFIAHALCWSPVADLHPPKDGPILSDMGQFNFLDESGNVRPGLEVFNEYC